MIRRRARCVPKGHVGEAAEVDGDVGAGQLVAVAVVAVMVTAHEDVVQVGGGSEGGETEGGGEEPEAHGAGASERGHLQ